MPWATTADVLTYTGATVADADVTRAQALIEVAVARAEADIDAGAVTDLRYLRMAVAYQAAWMASHPEVFTEADVEAVSVEGHSQSNRLDPSALWLAPLARKAMSRLSWRGSRSVQEGLSTAPTDPDDAWPWRGMDEYGNGGYIGVPAYPGGFGGQL